MFTHCLFDATKNKSDFYKGKDCMKIFGKDLKEHAGKVKDYQKKTKMIPLTYEKTSIIKSKKIVIYAKKDLVKMTIIKNILKSDIIVIIIENTEVMLTIFVF